MSGHIPSLTRASISSPLQEHVLSVPELLEIRHDGELRNRWGSAQQNLRVHSRRGHVFLDRVGGDEALVVRPSRGGGAVHGVVAREVVMDLGVSLRIETHGAAVQGLGAGLRV